MIKMTKKNEINLDALRGQIQLLLRETQTIDRPGISRRLLETGLTLDNLLDEFCKNSEIKDDYFKIITDAFDSAKNDLNKLLPDIGNLKELVSQIIAGIEKIIQVLGSERSPLNTSL